MKHTDRTLAAIADRAADIKDLADEIRHFANRGVDVAPSVAARVLVQLDETLGVVNRLHVALTDAIRAE